MKGDADEVLSTEREKSLGKKKDTVEEKKPSHRRIELAVKDLAYLELGRGEKT